MKLIEWYVSEKQGVGNAYEFSRPKGIAQPWAKTVWKPHLLPKHKFTFYLLAHNKLLTKDRMPYEACKTCALCQQVDKSCCHLFF